MNRNALMAPIPVPPSRNMLASNDFPPDSIVGRMLAQQRAQEAQKKAPPKPAPQRKMESATSVLQRRMREAGLE